MPRHGVAWHGMFFSVYVVFVPGIVNPSSWSLMNSLIVAYRVESRATSISSSVLEDDETKASTSMVTSTATATAANHALSTSMTGTGTTHGLASQTTLDVDKANSAQQVQEKMSLKYYDFGGRLHVTSTIYILYICNLLVRDSS